MIRYTDKQKLDAVKAYRKGGGGLLATAAAQGVNVASLRKWVAGYDSLGDAGVVMKRRSNYDPALKGSGANFQRSQVTFPKVRAGYAESTACQI
ncbi:transposase, partial [Variovorax sp. WDL1]|uniref:transposase n=1 Tax=Variovorax sp. WDL1 TaxID=207745 RepID=UPI000A773DE3